MNEMRKLMEAVQLQVEDAEQNFNDDWKLRKKVSDIIVPQVEDDANPEEWIQLMIYAFDDLDVPFNVGVAKTILADYGMEPHCDLQARFGESVEEELEVIGEVAEYSAEGALFAGGFDAGFDFANEQCEHNWGKGLDPAEEDEIKRQFYDFAGPDTKYTLQEDETSAALHTVNANYAQLKEELAKLVAYHKNEQEFDGWYLLEDLESIVERYSK